MSKIYVTLQQENMAYFRIAMKHDLRLLPARIGGDKARLVPHHKTIAFEALSKHCARMGAASFRRMWAAVRKGRLPQTMLDKLALFAGFQDWKDFDDALHGDVDASVNYNEERPRKPQ